MMTNSKGMDLSVLGVTVGFALWVCVALSVLATFANPNGVSSKHPLRPADEEALVRHVEALAAVDRQVGGEAPLGEHHAAEDRGN